MSFDKYKAYTQARIGLGRSGAALPTKSWLEFSYQHAAAVDAIREPWNTDQSFPLKTQLIESAVNNREEYLLRPDKGRVLSEKSIEKLNDLKTTDNNGVLICVSNGLSSYAVENHASHFISLLIENLESINLKIYNDTIFLVPNGRVGLIDEIGEILKPQIALMIIGERPGLSSPDSLAMYLTYGPKKGLNDAYRNCISNIRPPHGLSYEEAVFKSVFLIEESLLRKLSGVNLKDMSNMTLEDNSN